MKNIKLIALLMIVITAGLLQSCNERENYMDGPKSIDIVDEVLINGKSAVIDHLSGRIDISLAGDTDLTNVAYEATAPNGVAILPESGVILDLTLPVEVVASNGTSERTYKIYAKLLPSKIAFLGDGATIDECADDDVRAAALWTQQTYGENFIYIPYSGLSDEVLEEVNVLVYVFDQVGSADQPQALLDNLNYLSKFYVQGGKIVAGLLGTGLVDELGRDTSEMRTIIGTGPGGDNPDTWGIGFTNSEVANIISSGLNFYEANKAFVIDSGYKEDHNSLWNYGDIDVPQYANFNSMYNAEPIAAWDWAVEGEGFGGIIVWNPTGRFEGYMITIGIGGMEWSMNDGRDNPYLSNVHKVYQNSIEYLGTK